MFKARTYLKQGEKRTATAAQALQGLLAALRFSPDLFAVFEIWDRETRGLIKGCEAVAIQGSRICVRVPSVVHRQELLYSKQRILNRVTQALGRTAITDIFCELDADKGVSSEQVKTQRRGRHYGYADE
jgi:hypothetical protein